MSPPQLCFIYFCLNKFTHTHTKKQPASPGSSIPKDKQHCSTHDKELKQNTKFQKTIS